jgi:hypothetical protein
VQSPWCPGTCQESTALDPISVRNTQQPPTCITAVWPHAPPCCKSANLKHENTCLQGLVAGEVLFLTRSGPIKMMSTEVDFPGVVQICQLSSSMVDLAVSSVKRARRDEAPRALARHPFPPQPRPSRRAHRPERRCPHLQVDSFTVTYHHTLRSQGGSRLLRRTTLGFCSSKRTPVRRSEVHDLGSWTRAASTGCDSHKAIISEFPA